MEGGTWQAALAWGLPVVFIIIGFVAGSRQERRHFLSLAHRESVLEEVLVTNMRALPAGWRAGEVWLEQGAVVISSDAFKTFAAWLRGFVGGRLSMLESLMERARREAILRLVERAREKGATHILNLRLVSANVASSPGGGNGMIAAEVLAYGTAVAAKRE